MLAAALLLALVVQTPPPEPIGPLPSARQLAWQELEMCAFVHFGVNTFTDREWGEGTESPEIFAPTELDCRQWVSVCKRAGMKGIVLTAKHHDGFCLWPSKLSKHTVAASGWRDGKGDVLRELSDACKEAGLGLGLYLSPWDRNQPAYGDSPAYNDIYAAQLEEILTGYGPLFEIWWDGACGEGPNGKRQVYDWERFTSVARRCQPNAVIFSDIGPDIRWVGNENGFAGETCWSMLSPAGYGRGETGPPQEMLNRGLADGTTWIPAECDVSIRPGWFYHASQDGEVKSLAQLIEIWHASVGRNGSLLLNLPVDRRGLVHENDAARLLELRTWLRTTYEKQIAPSADGIGPVQVSAASASNVRGGDPTYRPEGVLDESGDTFWGTDDDVREAWLELDMGLAQRVDRIVLQEPIALGQRVSSFEVQAQLESGWTTVARGTTIGHKRILVFPTVRASKVRVHILESRACPLLSRVSLHLAPQEPPSSTR